MANLLSTNFYLSHLRVTKRKLILAVDFDGTITIDTNNWPKCSKIRENAKEVINCLHDDYNCEIIIWTCRDNSFFNDLDMAKEFLHINDIHYDTINENTKAYKKLWRTMPRKVGADIYIDDKAMLGQEINWVKIFEYVKTFKETHSIYL